MPEQRRRSAHRNRGHDNRRPARQAQRRTPGDAVRKAAYDVLRAVDTRDAYANLVLPAMLREHDYQGAEKAASEVLETALSQGNEK